MKSETDKIIKFTLLYNQHKQRLYNFILKLSGDSMITDDIVQSTFIKFYENFENIKSESSIRAWLFKTARNEFINHYNRSKRTVEYSTSSLQHKKNDLELEVNIELKEIKEIVLNELNNISNEQREVYLLKEYGGLSYKEISETLGIETKLVKSRLYKVRQKLIERISKLV